MCGQKLLHLLASSALLFLLVLPPSAAQSAIRRQIDNLTATTSLDRDGIQPWHMRLSFELFDQTGKQQETGTIEEWWAGPDHARLVITSPSYNQVLPGGDEAVSGREAYLVHLLLSEVVHPAPHIADPDSFISTVASQPFGQISLSCTTLSVKGEEIASSEYCTDPNTGNLRVVFRDGMQSNALNNISSVLNSQIAMTHTIAYAGKPAIKGHIESIEPFDPDHSGLQLGAITSPHDPKLTSPVLLTHIPPAYPGTPSASGQSGMVVLHMRILPNGKHSAIDTIASTGPLFTRAALDAVGRWSYTPMKRNKVATESDTTITITFLPQSKKRDIPHVEVSERDTP